jgi:glycosyltransferase involved in cell wall biosynthesis
MLEQENSRLRILVLNYEFPPVGGGGGRVAEDICRVLATHGHEIRVQTSLVRGLPKLEHRDGYSIYRTFSFRRRADRCTVPEMAAFVITNFLPSLRHVIRWRPHLIHVHFAVPTGVVAWAVSVITGIPYVLTVHLGDVPGAIPEQTAHLFRIVKPFTFPIWRRASRVTAVSEFVRQLALASYDVEIEMLPNGIELIQCTPSPSAPNTPRRLVFAGRFNPQKNLFFLLDLLDRVVDLEWRLDMLGDGDLMEAVRARLQGTRLEKRVCLHGWVAPERVSEVMSQSDILILPSIVEGMPVVGVKALGHGLAILGSDIPGLADVVQNGINGSLCPVNDSDAFERALRTMLMSDDILRRMKAASREMALKFDLQMITCRYEKIFQEIGVTCK